MLSPLVRAGVVRFSGQQQSRGCWDIYMDTTNTTQLHHGDTGHHGEDQVVSYPRYN